MRFVCLLALLPFAAGAQVTLTADTYGTGPIKIGRTACKNQSIINFHWDVTTGHPLAGETVHTILAKSSSTCGNTIDKVESADVVDTPAPTQTQTGAAQVKATDLIRDTDAGLPGGCDNTTHNSSNPYTTYYCVQLATSTTVTGSASIAIKFATAPPTSPADVRVEPGDQHLKVDWTQGGTGEDIASYDVHVRAADAGFDATKYAERVSAATSADVTTTDDGAELQNDVAYTVQVVANDSYGNASDPSDAGTGTPKHVLDFYNLYRDKGGGALGGGGCSSAGAATWIAGLVLAAGLLARRRRSRKLRAGGTLLLGLALLAPAARADWRAPERPPRRFLVGFKIDRYDPKIDSEAAFDGLAAQDRPYFQIFRGRAPLRYQLEVDWEVAHPFGSILLGGTVGYWQNFGKGLTAATRQPSSDTALLDVIPVGLVATYRFDWLADRWARFPFIPYAQIGLQRALWASFSGTGAVSKDPVHGGRGSGWTWGYTTALGFALNLNAIDPELAREAYVDTGIQRTALFAEYGWTRLDGFRGGDVMILSDRAWRFGLSMEF